MRLLTTILFCAFATPTFADWQQISNANTFASQVVGNSYVDSDGNWFRFNADGSLSGGSRGRELTGDWRFTRGFACFNRSVGGQAAPSDCIVVLVDGRQLVTVRNEGKGSQALYTRQ